MPGVVGAAVVDRDDLQTFARVVARREAAQREQHLPAFVVRRHHHREPRQTGIADVVNGAIAGREIHAPQANRAREHADHLHADNDGRRERARQVPKRLLGVADGQHEHDKLEHHRDDECWAEGAVGGRRSGRRVHVGRCARDVPTR